MCRIGWTGGGVERDMGINDLMIKCQFWAHSRPSIRMLDRSGERTMQAKRKDVSTWLCAAWCAQEQTLTGQSASSLKCTLGLKTSNTYLTQGGHRRGGIQSSSLVPVPQGELMVLLTFAGQTGVAVGGAKGRGEACSYVAHCAMNSGCQAAGVSCMSTVRGSETWIPASSL